MKLMYERSLPIDLVVNAGWIISDVLIMRFTLMDMPFLYMVACTCYFHLRDKMANLTDLVDQMDERNFGLTIFQFLISYKDLMRDICEVNKLIKFLMTGINVNLVPYVSLYIVIAITQVETLPQLAMKLIMIGLASVYSIRGLILTTVLAQIDYQGKTLHQKISSALARGHIKHVHSKLWLMQIMEDLASSKNHLVMREYGSKVSQTDVFENIIKVAQFTMLLIEFTRKIYPSSIV